MHCRHLARMKHGPESDIGTPEPTAAGRLLWHECGRQSEAVLITTQSLPSQGSVRTDCSSTFAAQQIDFMHEKLYEPRPTSCCSTSPSGITCGLGVSKSIEGLLCCRGVLSQNGGECTEAFVCLIPKHSDLVARTLSKAVACKSRSSRTTSVYLRSICNPRSSFTQLATERLTNELHRHQARCSKMRAKQQTGYKQKP